MLKITGFASVIGLYSANGQNSLIGSHSFDVKADGVTHYINGEKRAEIAAENWPAYCETVQEAAEAQAKLDAAAAKSAPQA